MTNGIVLGIAILKMSEKMSSLINEISQFINTYYLDPIRTDSGYNPVNTFTWAISTGDLHIRSLQASRKAGG
ncbi:MAG: DUF63 family protein [Methanosarcina sp.]